MSPETLATLTIFIAKSNLGVKEEMKGLLLLQINQRTAALAREEGTKVNDSHIQQAIQSVEKDVREGNTQALFGGSVPNSADIKNGVTGQIADAQNKTAPADNIKTGGSVPTSLPSNNERPMPDKIENHEKYKKLGEERENIHNKKMIIILIEV